MTKQPPLQASERSFPHLRVVPGGAEEVTASADLSERVVLAACMSDASLIDGFDWLLPEHFRLGQHARVWAALRSLQAASPAPLPPAPCLVDVARQLHSDGRLVEVGGTAALAQIVDLTPDVIDLESHAEAIHAAYQQRQIGSWAASLSAVARTTPTAPGALLDGAASALADLQAQARVGQPPGVLLGDAAAQLVATLDAPEPVSHRISTGFSTLDGEAGGMGRGHLWILGGRPSMGKTALAANIVLNVAWAQESAAMFSLEMTREEISARCLASEGGIPMNAQRNPESREAMADAAARIKRLPFWIDDTPGLSLAELQRRARALAARSRAKGRRLALIVVDYLQLLSVPHVHGRKRADEIAEVSKSLKLLARQLDCTVLALAQLNRESEREQRRPRMTDLRDCGQIEQDADWIGILWRQKNTPEWETDLAICKNRGGKMTEDLKLGWQPELTRFSDG